jgi:hypothetical protein
MFLECPNCKELIEIKEEEIFCGIFRHAVYKNNMEQINPHASKQECDRLTENNDIFGCGMPFRCVKTDSEYILEKCDYI